MYKIIIDSCGELTEAMKEDGHFVSVPLTLEVDEAIIVDDETFDQMDLDDVNLADCAGEICERLDQLIINNL